MQPNPTVYGIGESLATELRQRLKDGRRATGRRWRAAETYAHTWQMKSLATRICMRVTAAYFKARRGAQRLRKAIRSGRGSGYIHYAVAIFFWGPFLT